MQSVIGEHSRSLDPVVGGLDSHWFGLHSLEVRQTELEVELGATRRNSPSAQPECGMHCVNEWLGSGRQVPEGQSSQTFSSSANILPGPHSFGVVVVHVNVAVVTVVVAMLVVVLVTVVVVLVTDVVEVEDVRVAVVEVTVIVVLVTVVMVLVTDVVEVEDLRVVVHGGAHWHITSVCPVPLQRYGLPIVQVPPWSWKAPVQTMPSASSLQYVEQERLLVLATTRYCSSQIALTFFHVLESNGLTVIVVLVTVVMVLVTDVAVAVVIVTVMGAVVAESSSTVQRAACWKIAITECHIKEVL